VEAFTGIALSLLPSRRGMLRALEKSKHKILIEVPALTRWEWVL